MGEFEAAIAIACVPATKIETDLPKSKHAK